MFSAAKDAKVFSSEQSERISLIHVVKTVIVLSIRDKGIDVNIFVIESVKIWA